MMPPDIGPRPCANSGVAASVSAKIAAVVIAAVVTAASSEIEIELAKLLLLRTAFSFSGDPAEAVVSF